MKTNFFRLIEHLQSKGSWTLHIKPQPDGKMIVSVLLSDPVSEKAGVSLTPMIFNETAQVLDDTLFTKLTEPVKQITELFINAGEVQKSIDNAKKLLEEKAKGKTDASKAPKADDGAEKKKKYEDAVKKSAELSALCKYEDAITALPEIAEYPDKKLEIEKLRTELETKKKQLSLL